MLRITSARLRRIKGGGSGSRGTSVRCTRSPSPILDPAGVGTIVVLRNGFGRHTGPNGKFSGVYAASGLSTGPFFCFRGHALAARTAASFS